MGKSLETNQQASGAFIKETIQRNPTWLRNQIDRGQPVGYSQSVVELNSGPSRTNPEASGRTEFEPVTRACCDQLAG